LLPYLYCAVYIVDSIIRQFITHCYHSFVVHVYIVLLTVLFIIVTTAFICILLEWKYRSLYLTTVSHSHYIESDNLMTANNELEMISKEVDVA
jgi:hypothetical protein